MLALAIFLSVTLALTWLWLNGGGSVYGKLFLMLGAPLYELFGVYDISVRPRLRYANFIPFVGLVAATPGLSWSRRARVIAIGLPVFFASHWFLNLSAVAANQYQLSPVAKLLADGFPFLLWGILCRNALAPLGALALGPPRDPLEIEPETPEGDAQRKRHSDL